MSRDLERLYNNRVKKINDKYEIGSDKWSRKLNRLGSLEDFKSKKDDVFGFMKTPETENVLLGTSQLIEGVNSSVQNYTGTQQMINSGAHKVMQSLGPWGMLASAVTGTADAIGAAAGAKVDVLDSSTAARAGVSAGNKAGEMLSAIPGMGWVTGLFAQKTADGDKSAYIDSMSPGYSKSVQDINASAAGGGKKMLFGAKNMNAFIQKQNQANELITNIAMESEMARQNDAATLYQSQNFNKYSGTTPRLLMAKDGAKVHDLHYAKNLLQRVTDYKIKDFNAKVLLKDIVGLLNSNSPTMQSSIGKKISEKITAYKSELSKLFKKENNEKALNALEDISDVYNVQTIGIALMDVVKNNESKKEETVSRFQLGGKIIDTSKNIIPDGALHKNLNHLSDINEELVDQITRKGVPVVSEDAEGNITQHAEVEVGEIIFTLENSQKLEEYWKQYKETGDDSIAIECGKFVTHEILRNTVDKAGVKKQVE